ncbi:MAG: hypothetical protein Kow002_07440 [Anaerolineales bacterium]
MDLKLSNLLYEIEEILYQLFTWLAVYPKTLLKGFFKPGWVQSYVHEELAKALKERFSEFLHPIVLWLFSILVIVWSATPSAEDATGTTVEGFFLMLILFATFPIIFAVITLRAIHTPLTRDTFQRPLYTQMLIFGIFQTTFGLMLAIMPPLLELVTPTTDTSFMGILITVTQFLLSLFILAIFIIPLIWLPIAEIAVLKKELETRWYKVIGWVLLGLLLISIIIANINALSAEIDIFSNIIDID